MRRISINVSRITAALACLILAGAAAGNPPPTAPIVLPGGSAGIGFDDMGFSPAIGRVLVPGGRTGMLFLIDPKSRQVEQIGGFSTNGAYRGGHGEGITSADAGSGVIFVTDRSMRLLNVVDEQSRKTVSTANLAAGPDYVRYVRATNEVWVTEPRAARIEIFAISGESAPVHSGFIAVPSGPESLVIDNDTGRAYSNQWADTTLALDLKRRSIVSRWTDGCRGPRGLALDPGRSILFVGCEEGKLSVLDVKSGRVLGSSGSVAGVDIIAYNPALHHVYLPGAESASMNVVDVSNPGAPRILETVSTAKGAHCVADDDRNNAYVCDPRRGRLLVFHDGR